jgi:hypothetical protein
MIRFGRLCLAAAAVLAALGWSGGPLSGGFLSQAVAVVGRPATPLSVAGVARRSTVRAVATPVLAPGVGVGGVGGPASGVGVLPGAGAGQAGVGYSAGVGVNAGGPVNRVGVR